MVSLASSLIWLLATSSLAESTPRDPAHPNTDYAPHPPPRAAIRPRPGRPAFGGGTVDGVVNGSGEGGRGKVLRYPLQKTAVNGTALRRRRRSVQRVPIQEEEEEEEGQGGRLEKREKWHWKHLEDFRGYLYFMES